MDRVDRTRLVELCGSRDDSLCCCFKAQQAVWRDAQLADPAAPPESAARCKTKTYDVNVTGRPGRQRAVHWKTLQCCEEAQNGGDESFG